MIRRHVQKTLFAVRTPLSESLVKRSHNALQCEGYTHGNGLMKMREPEWLLKTPQCRSYSGIVQLALNNISDNRGAKKKKKRVGRGLGSGKGKTCGKGHKGQRARSGVKLGFEGGQTALRRSVPKKNFYDRFALLFQPVTLGTIAQFINCGKIDSSELITMKTLWDVRAIRKRILDGVHLYEEGAEYIKWPIHIEVSRTTDEAKAAVEALGGTVRKVHYNKLGLRALLKPESFEKKRRLIPRNGAPKPKIAPLVDSLGRLPAPTKPILD